MIKRRLAAIMFTDVVGYTAMMEKDERQAMRVLAAHKEGLEELSTKFNAEIIEYFGDGSLTLFHSVHEAVGCARELQLRLAVEGVVPLRIGIHIGEVLQQEDKIFGDGVNVASRIESSGYAGTVLLSQAAYDKVKNQPEYRFQDVGEFVFKNVEQPMRLHGLVDNGLPEIEVEKLGNRNTKRTSRTRTWFVAGLILLLIAVVTAGLTYWIGDDTEIQVVDDDALLRIAVFPFEVKGSDQVAYLKEGLVDVISTKIDGVAGFSAIDPNMTIGYFKENQDKLLDPGDYAVAAQELGAEEFVLGNVITLGSDVRLKIAQYDRKGNLKSTEEVVIKGLSELLDGVDELIRQTIAERYMKSGQSTTAAQTMFSTDIEALKFYLQGEEQRRLGNYEVASRFYRNALDRDSTMALTWLSLWQVCSWSFQCGLSEEEILLKAERYSVDLPVKMRDYIKTCADWQLYRPGDHEQRTRDLIERYGESTELLTLLGEMVFHTHIQKERPATEALPYFLKAFEYDPGNVEVLNHVIQLLSYQLDATRLGEILERIPRKSVNWSVTRAAYLVCRQEPWSDEDVKELIESPGFQIDAIFLRSRSEKNLDRFGQLFRDLEQIDGKSFQENEAPIHALYHEWYGKASEADRLIRASKFAPVNHYGIVLARLGIDVDGFESQKQDANDKLQIGRTSGPFPDDLPLALFAAEQKDESGFEKYLNSLEEVSGEDGIYRRSVLLAKGYWMHSAGDYYASNELLDSALVSYGRLFDGLSDAFMTGAITLVQAENHYHLGDKNKALLYFNVLMDVLDAGDDSKVGYSWLRRGEICNELQKNEEALGYLNMFLKMYQDCDPEFEPWVVRAEKAREEVFSRMN